MSQVCQACGACCAHFRVSFYWGETDLQALGSVPEALTVPVSPHRVAMRGTEVKPVRCVALTGEIGCSVACSIYELRSTTCRDFEAGTDRCNQARLAHGLDAIEAAAPPEGVS
ncbi:YkgJ family cysteine cluster protein [Paraburkholderia lacunae]|uniref:Zinc/iron-chelating domain-containing protein n=1 Tax=Paraburkholderia lacunae TaxID=2211104 RepID=A0A370N9D5_9BURK|nr:YkgJ family cysteine cluster protein [Paraburkholderia lacunae]RDK02203.1 zinc/iron-chelating domain-containing protein [Paraburkholderia lacunae]